MQKIVNEIDIALVGGGIMSATLATILHEIDPKLKIHLFEKLPSCGEERSANKNAPTLSAISRKRLKSISLEYAEAPAIIILGFSLAAISSITS